MRTKRYYSKKRRTLKKKKMNKNKYKKMKGGDYPLDQLNQIPTRDYIPYGGNIIGNFDYPEQAKNTPNGLLDVFMRGGKKRNYRKSFRKNSIKNKRGGSLMSIIPQQLVNTGRGVSSFFMDKVNGYQGYPSQPSYLPYNQPIDNINDVDLINYF
jgi:hypothetical protein